jgi:hypothetical protein
MGLYQNVLPIILLNAFPFLCVLAIWCLRFFEHLLPSKQHEMLEKLVKMAVTMAEQAYDDYSPLEKKRIALRAAVDLFNAFHLPLPQAEALNTAIEAAVFAVRQTQVQSKMVRDGRPCTTGKAVPSPIIPATHSSIVPVTQKRFAAPSMAVTPNPDLLSTIPTQTL